MVTAFVNAYYEKTGVPVVAISASRGQLFPERMVEQRAEGRGGGIA